MPTPPGNEPIEQVLWLLETNNGCQLPCWWGITPGQTTWESAERFFNSFVTDIPYVSGSSVINYSPRIPLPFEVFGVDYLLPTYTVRDGIVISINVDVYVLSAPVDPTPSYLMPYVLSAFLTSMGQPTEVWLFTYSYSYENHVPFSVVLFYRPQGVVAIYGDNGEIQGDFVQGCPQETPVHVLLLKPSNSGQTFQQIKSGTSVLNREYLPLEEATGLDVATFYETFRQPENTTCLQTPAELWR